MLIWDKTNYKKFLTYYKAKIRKMTQMLSLMAVSSDFKNRQEVNKLVIKGDKKNITLFSLRDLINTRSQWNSYHNVSRMYRLSKKLSDLVNPALKKEYLLKHSVARLENPGEADQFHPQDTKSLSSEQGRQIPKILIRS